MIQPELSDETIDELVNRLLFTSTEPVSTAYITSLYNMDSHPLVCEYLQQVLQSESI